MKTTLLLVAVLACMSLVTALPTLLDLPSASSPDLVPEESDFEEVAHYRERRATCDVLSFQSKWVTPNHSGCALHCIFKGYRGGSCKNTVCHCRR